jgi:N-acetylmuramoyl-L-alanine amidase
MGRESVNNGLAQLSAGLYLAPMTPRHFSRLASLLALSSACAASPGRPTSAGGPVVAEAAVEQGPKSVAIDSVIGPLDLVVRYPAAGAVIDAPDSSFMFGSTGSGDAVLTINGAPVRVAPNGAWLAWVALPRDSVMRFELVARTPRETRRTELLARRPARYQPPASGVWIDPGSIEPRGQATWPRDEFIPVMVRAHPDAQVRLRLPGNLLVPMARDTRLDEPAWGIRAFDSDTQNLRRGIPPDRYIALLRGRAVDSAQVEAVVGSDTVRAPWPVRIALLDSIPAFAELDGGEDGVTIGRAARGGTYHWFWATGTRVRLTGLLGDDARVQVAPGIEAWIPAADARPIYLPSPPGAVAGSVALTPMADRARLRIPLSQPVPYEIIERERSVEVLLYGAVGDVNWIRYGPGDTLVTRIAWSQEPEGVRLVVDLADPVWGFRAGWDRGDLLLDLRRPPAINAGKPFDGRLIVVDAGHPPLGASGPTGLTEAEANLGVALELQRMLEDAGARVIMTRTDATPVALGARPRLADSLGADLLLSIHNNALPDGVNPFPNNGTSVYYNHPRSIPLAAAVQRALVRRLGLRDLGIGRGDLALVRPTWMPAILTEGLFMMVPEQEAMLRSEGGRHRYAQGVFEGVREFLRGRARD